MCLSYQENDRVPLGMTGLLWPISLPFESEAHLTAIILLGKQDGQRDFKREKSWQTPSFCGLVSVGICSRE